MYIINNTIYKINNTIYKINNTTYKIINTAHKINNTRYKTTLTSYKSSPTQYTLIHKLHLLYYYYYKHISKIKRGKVKYPFPLTNQYYFYQPNNTLLTRHIIHIQITTIPSFYIRYIIVISGIYQRNILFPQI